jgi:hypothetical protein
MTADCNAIYTSYCHAHPLFPAPCIASIKH